MIKAKYKKMPAKASDIPYEEDLQYEICRNGSQSVLALVAAIFLSDDILYAFAMFGIIYGLTSYYVWYFKKTGFSFSVWVGEKGLLMTLLSIALKVLAPLIILSIIAVTCNSLLPSGIGATIGGLIIAVICLGFLALDVLTIINHFNPSVKLPFSKDNGVNGK